MGRKGVRERRTRALGTKTVMGESERESSGEWEDDSTEESEGWVGVKVK